MKGGHTARALAPHRDATHVVYTALNEQPELVRGWRDPANAELDTRMPGHALDAFKGGSWPSAKAGAARCPVPRPIPP